MKDYSRSNQDIGRRYALAALTSSIGGGVSMALYGIAPLALARLLGPRDYGVYAAAMAATNLVSGLFQMGQHSVLHKMLPEHGMGARDRGGAVLADILILTIGFLAVSCALFLAGARWIATSIYFDEGLTTVLQMSALLISCITLFNLSASVTAGLQDYRAYNGGMLLRSVAYVLLASLGAARFGLMGAFWGQLLALALSLVVVGRSAARLARRRFPGMIRPDFSREALAPIAAFVLPAFLLTLLNLPAYWWISALLARSYGFSEVGLFSVAYALTQIIWLLPVNLYVPAMTFLSEAYAARNRELVDRLVNENLRAIWLLTTPIAVAAALLSPTLPRLLFGSAYEGASPIALILSFAAPLMAMIGLINTAISAAGRIWRNVAITTVWAASFAIGTWLCVPRWGAAGAALAFSLSQLLYIGMLYAYLARIVGLNHRAMAAMALLTVLTDALTAFIAYGLQGSNYYLAAGTLLVALLLAEWRWVCGDAERRVVGKGVAFLKLAAARS